MESGRSKSTRPGGRVVQKVVGYVVHDGRLLVFTHDDVALEIAGVQVPAGTLEAGESPAEAVLREAQAKNIHRTGVGRSGGRAGGRRWSTLADYLVTWNV